jgi:hypothetical protein
MRSAPPVRGGLAAHSASSALAYHWVHAILPGAMADDLSSVLSIALLYDLPIDSRC